MMIRKCFGLLFMLNLLSCDPAYQLRQLNESVVAHFPATQPQTYLSHQKAYCISCDSLHWNLYLIDSFFIALDQMPDKGWNNQYLLQKQALKEHLNQQFHFFNQLKEDPSVFNLGGKLHQNLTDSSLNSSQKLGLLEYNLLQAPNYYIEARKCIHNPIPSKTSLSLSKQLYSLDFLSHQLIDSLVSWQPDTTESLPLQKERAIARLAIKDYLAFCKSVLVNGG